MSGLEGYLDQEELDANQERSRAARKLGREMLAFKLPLLGGLLLVVVGTLAALIEPWLFSTAIDRAILPKDLSLLRWLTLAFLSAVLVRVLCAVGQAYLFEVLGNRVTQSLRVRLFSHLQRLPMATLNRNPSGRLLTRVTNDVASLSEMFSAGFVSMASNLLFVAGILVGLLLLHPKLALVSVAIFPALVAVSVVSSRRLSRSYREARSKLSTLNAFFAENLFGIKVVQLFNRQALHLSRFDRIARVYAEAQTGTVKVFAFFQPSITFSAGVSLAATIAYGGELVLRGEIPVGVWVAFFSYALLLFQPIREIADKWNVFLSGLASAERVFSILEWPTEIPSGALPPARRLEGVQGRITFEGVSFAYEGERWVLQDLNLDFLPGQRIGVVGHTGAGKTTLMALLMRFYDPQKGRILLDGRDLRSFDLRDLRATFGMVQQDVYLFSGVSQELTEAAFEKAFTSIGLKPPASSVLQERASNLSVGERQVLAFARVAERDPAVWILDEATANLDSQTEDSLQRALEARARGRTQLTIAHRLATIRCCDQIVVLHRGRVAEHGTHEELLARKGVYERLHRYQVTAPRAELASPSASARP